MITGYNSDIELDGKVFHVQTEDKGLDNPVMETLVYCGGQVVASVLTSYADLAESPDYSQDRILRRMQEQHQSLIADLEHGKLESQPVIRRQAIATSLDADNLLEEYLEDWIDSSALIEPVHRTLESDIETIRTRAATPNKRGQKKKNATILAVAIVGLGLYAAFELGRVSLQGTDPPVETDRTVPSVVEPRTSTLQSDSISMTARGLEPPLLGEVPAVTPAADQVVEKTTIADSVTDPGPEKKSLQTKQPLPILETAPDVTRVSPPPPVVTVPNSTAHEDVPNVPESPSPAPKVEVIPDLVVPEASTRPAFDAGPFEVDEVDQPPTSIATQLPAYTEAGLRQARQGSVRMTVLVGTDGNVDAVRLLDEISESDLNRAAITAILHWRFNPGTHRGQPARVWVPIRLDFSLTDNDQRSVVSLTLE